MSKYKLINPSIRGNLTNSFTGKNPSEAASNAWNTISEHMTNNVPKFAFTLENNEDGKLYHFLVKESMDGGEYADYKIKELDLKLKQNDIKKFKEKSQNFIDSEIKGGKHKKKKHKHKILDDSSSSDFLSHYKLHKLLNYPQQQPFVYWWYDPLIYNLESVYIPTFVAPITPYIEVATINYYPY